MTGRRPTRSDSTPRIGDTTNCNSAQTVANIPPMMAALANLLPSKFRMSFGKTGTMMPNASMSSSTVMKTKVSAALRLFNILGSANAARRLPSCGERAPTQELVR